VFIDDDTNWLEFLLLYRLTAAATYSPKVYSFTTTCEGILIDTVDLRRWLKNDWPGTRCPTSSAGRLNGLKAVDGRSFSSYLDYSVISNKVGFFVPSLW
jgi:hypothetical protein